MAGITGHFTADFKSFYDAVAQARVKLKDFQSDAEAVAQKVDKVANAFSGRKLVQDAEIMTKAITEIGGATALTAKEQASVNAKLTEALEKYKALGQVAPQEMQDLEKATRAVNKETKEAASGFDKAKSGVLSLAGAMGIAFSVDALVGFVGSVFDAASQITDLSQKIGISTGAVQRFKYAAEQSGASIDDIGSAISKMNEKLATGDKSTVHALTDVGLKLADLRTMSPEQAFLAITDALQGIENPAERARIAMDLLGEAGVRLGPAIEEGLARVGDTATIMADDTIRRLDEAKQAWENLANFVTVKTGEMIANAMKFRGSHQIVERAARGGAAAPGETNLTAAELAEIEKIGGFGPEPATGIQAGAAERERLAREREAAARKQQAAIDELRRAEDEYAKLLADDVVKAYEATRIALQDYYLMILKANTGITAGIEGLTFRKNTEVNILAGLTGQWFKYLDAIESVNKQVKLGLESAPGVAMDVDALAGIWGKDEQAARARELKKAEAFGAQFMGTIINAVRGGGGVGAALGATLGATIGESLGASMSKAIGGKLGSMLGGMLGPLAALGGELLGKLTDKLFGKLFGKGEGRKSVEAFAESMGGFDALQKELEALGEEGARLWIKLTQGTDKGNPEQAARNIAEVEEALRKHKEATDDVTGATEEQARATIETASEAERAMKALEPLLKANEDQWRAWGDVVNSQIDRVASALRSLALPNLSGAALQQPAPNAGSGGGTAVLQVDGRVLAEAVVPRIPGVVKRYGLA